eukprot:4098535-Pyramimonas_sp.AAC.1
MNTQMNTHTHTHTHTARRDAQPRGEVRYRKRRNARPRRQGSTRTFDAREELTGRGLEGV